MLVQLLGAASRVCGKARLGGRIIRLTGVSGDAPDRRQIHNAPARAQQTPALKELVDAKRSHQIDGKRVVPHIRATSARWSCRG